MVNASRRHPWFLTVLAAGLMPSNVDNLAAESPAPATPVRDTVSGRIRSLDTVKILGRIDDLVGIAASASRGRVGTPELRSPRDTRVGELLESVPGMIVTQHSGEGKANQFFVRG